MKPRLRGNRLDMWNWDRWNVIPASPRITAPGASALKSCELEQASRMSARTLRNVPAAHLECLRWVLARTHTIPSAKEGIGRRYERMPRPEDRRQRHAAQEAPSAEGGSQVQLRPMLTGCIPQPRLGQERFCAHQTWQSAWGPHSPGWAPQ